jgi:hypothetical protein
MSGRTSTFIPYVIRLDWEQKVQWADYWSYAPPSFICEVHLGLFFNDYASSKFLDMFNFRRNPLTIFEIDYTIADCYRAMGPEGE